MSILVAKTLLVVIDNPDTSIKVASQQVPGSVGTVHNIVRKQLKLYPYKIPVVQALKPADYEKRH